MSNLQPPVIALPIIDALGEEDAKKLCEAICDCKSAERKQDCVAKKYCKDGRIWPVHDPNDSTMLPEVTYRIPKKKGGTFQPMMSGTGRTTPGGAPAPMAIPKAMSRGKALGKGKTVRWDFVQVVDPTKPPVGDNVKNTIEIKYPPDNPTDNQMKAMKKMSKSDRQKHIQMGPDDCGCGD